MAAANISQWGVDDCITYLLPAGAERPAWLADCTCDEDAIALAVVTYGSVGQAYEAMAEQYGMERLNMDEQLQPSDRVVLSDTLRGEVAGVVQEDFSIHMRIASGVRRCTVGHIHSKWRLPPEGD